MAGVNYQVHKLVELKGRRGMKVVDYSNPNAYIKLAHKDHGAVFIQRGKLMYEDGEPIPTNKIPDWVLEEIKKCNPVTLKEAGFAVKSILDEIEEARKAKSDVRKEAKKEAARAAAKKAAKKANKNASRASQALPDEPEPEDVGLTEETEEETEND